MTSASDSSSYRGVVEDAVSSDVGFSSFKSRPAYRKILEHVSKAEGSAYIRETPKHLWRFLDKFKENDLIGSPERHDYGEIGIISPTTLRYIKQLGDLERLFGDLSGKHIVEIGGGYGGLCKIITDVYTVGSYTIFDLDPVTKLIQKYLSRHDKVVKTIPVESVGDWKVPRCDLLISNYAFSECTEEVMDKYLRETFNVAKAGYLTINFLNDSQQLILHEKIKAQTGCEVKILQEIPLTHPSNYILTWCKD
ncbi:MAG: putative sugar O-methyltransferase [Nitrososphaerales archaeon]